MPPPISPSKENTIYFDFSVYFREDVVYWFLLKVKNIYPKEKYGGRGIKDGGGLGVSGRRE
ncbi:hypothetical protein FACS1894137_05160 [Spirochaetia bacterium]|nr:hypothetical protein FACS1894137_05160 [Spirochaetia bacterium]